MRPLAVTLLLLSLLAPVVAFAAPGNTYYGRLDFTGTSTVNTNFYIQLRDVGGTTQCATSDPFFLPSGTTGTACRDTIALGWRIIDGGCWSGTSRCRSYQITPSTPSIGVEVDGAGFTVFASTNGSTWTQVTTGSPFNFGSGLTMGIGTDTGTNVPTLSEWGMILLAATVGLGGIWTLRRRARAVA